MKQIHNKTPWLAVAALALLLSGCSKEPELSSDAEYSDVLILPVSELASDDVVVAPQSGTRAAADPTKAMTFYMVRADETGAGTGIYDAYGTTPLPAVRAAGTGATNLTFSTLQYYLATYAKTKLTGWYPAATSTAGSVVKWTIDGTQDILTAVEQWGNMVYPMPNLLFDHRLAQIQVHTYTTDANVQALWGTITKIELLEQVKEGTYDFSVNAATGAVIPTSGNTGALTVGGITDATIPVGTAAQVGDPVMIFPQTTATVLKLAVTTSKRGKVSVSMPAGVYVAGKASILKLKFNGYTIDATASIGEWQTIDRSEQEVTPPVPPPTIGEVKDGGVVYWIDPDDPTLYKVLALTESPTNLKWAAKDTYAIGPGAESATNAKGNFFAIKAYYNTNPGGIITETTFEDAFPAVAYCYNYQGKDGADAKGSWCLPAKTDLQYLWCAYNGYNPISWSDGQNTSVPKNDTAQGVFNRYLTGAGGVVLAPVFYFSSTEYNGQSAYGVQFARSTTMGLNKAGAGPVRCIKKVSPLVIGEERDGGVVYEVINATNYKVFSLTQGSSLMWSAQATYVLGTTGQDETDGRMNMSAMKAYSTAHTGDSDNTTKTTGILATDFPSAGFCDAMNTGGVTGWYLPAKDELEAFYTAYNANKAVFDGAIAANSGTAMASGTFWSGTESSTDNSYGWCVPFLTGNAGSSSKSDSGYARCIKSTGPSVPKIGDLRDGGIVYEVTGTKYKVISINQGTDMWAPKLTYTLGDGDGRDVTNGKKNVAAIKAYSLAHIGDSNATTKTTGVLSTDFPAAAYCDAMNTGGVTDWYFPAGDEVMAFYTAYKANQVLFDAVFAANGGVAVGARFWTATEYTADKCYAVNFGTGNMGGNNKTSKNSIRCVKEL